MNVETKLLERLEELSWLEVAERQVVLSPDDCPVVMQYLNDLSALESMPVPSPSLQRIAQGRLALLRAVHQPQRRLLAIPLVWAPRRLVQAIPATATAAVLVASTLGGAAVAGVDVPGASVNEVLSALGLREAPPEQNETPRAPIVLPVFSPTSSPSAPDIAGTSVPVPGLGDDGEQGNAVDPPGQGGENPGQGGNPPGQSGENPGQGGTPPRQGGENPGQGGNPPGQSGDNPGQGGAPPGQSSENPGQGGDNPGQSSENPGQGSDPGQGGDNPGQGNGNESTGPPEDPGQSGNNPGQGTGQGNKP